MSESEHLRRARSGYDPIDADVDDDWMPDDDATDPLSHKERCRCPFCFCMAYIEWGICDDCRGGAHQG